MNNLPVGVAARITGYQVNNSFTERLRELGLTVGTMFTVARKAPFNGPIELRYGRSRLVLRADEIDMISVECL